MKLPAEGVSTFDAVEEDANASWTLDRRSFIGASLASTSLVAVPAEPTEPAQRNPDELHFLEDDEGVTVVQYADRSRNSPPGRTTTLSWRLLARRFSANPRPFRKLRTLKDGAEHGYELPVFGARFGSVEPTNHYFTFLRSGADWSVRMRTELWLEEMTSGDVQFKKLCAANSETKFVFPQLKSVGLFGRRLSQIFEDHLQFQGSLQLAMNGAGLWTLLPARGGSIRAFDGAFNLPCVEFGWRGGTGSRDPKSSSRQPVFLAESAATARRGPLVLGSEQLSVRLEALFSEPDAETTSKPGSKAAPKPAAAPTPTTPTPPATKKLPWSYSHDDWALKETDREQYGTASLASDWVLDVRGHTGAVFGPVKISDGILRRTRAKPLTIDFVGRPALVQSKPIVSISDDQSCEFSVEDHFISPIGDLRVHGWSDDAADLKTQFDKVDLRHPRVTISSAGLRTPIEAIDIPLLLTRVDLAVGDCDFSEFTFKDAVFHGVFSRSPAQMQRRLAKGDNYVWLGASVALANQPLSRIDLSRARLAVSKTDQLAHMAFRFSGLHLEVRRGEVLIVDTVRACPVIQGADPAPDRAMRSVTPPLVDSRPTLVVEFSGQHVFEESIFRPNSAAFPDVRIPTDKAHPEEFFVVDWSNYGGKPPPNKEFPKETSAFVQAIRSLAPDQRIYARRKFADKQQDLETDSDKPFGTFSKAFETWFAGKDSPFFPSEQCIYVGPLGMDADVAAEARRWREETQLAVVEKDVTKMLGRADALINDLRTRTTASNFVDSTVFQFAMQWLIQLLSNRKSTDFPTATYARMAELAAAGTMSDYGFFRDFYAETMLRWRYAPAATGLDLPAHKGEFFPDDLEFFSESNRKGLTTSASGSLKDRQTQVVKLYAALANGRSLPKQLMRGRLSGTSRLAFRVACDAQLQFSFDALTDWSKHELAVTPRALQTRVFNEGGEAMEGEVVDEERTPASSAAEPTEMNGDEDVNRSEAAARAASAVTSSASAPVSEAASSAPAATVPTPESSDVRMLQALGFSHGRLVTAQDRLAEVEAALKVAPTSLETSIELPARLILSPSQNAAFRTRRALVHWRRDEHGPIPLWTADLSMDGLDPMLRAVHSPDLRPGFVRGGLERALAAGKLAAGNPLHTPAVYAPPRGPLAPWTIGIEQGDGQSSSAADLMPPVDSDTAFAVAAAAASAASAAASAAAAPGGAASTPSPTNVCDAPFRGALHPLLSYLCERKKEDSDYGEDAIFRSSLDAYDRHELVVLSSAYGLPVRGRRYRDTNGNLQLEPVRTSSQVDLPGLWQPKDVELGTALYRPRQLKIDELRLSALGGTLRHDTDFVPPSAARHALNGPLYDSLSVERWQHWVVLGRDVFAEVVYKGYLFPIGHRASLVKQTERVFLRGVRQGPGKKIDPIRAYLRQRMFVRIGQPDKVFPAPGQPNGGRQFPASRVRMLTRVSPDIVDPSADFTALHRDGDIAPGGRLFPAEAGLVFWPRTASVEGAEVLFDFQIESAPTRGPLLFVDNVAVNRPELLKKIVGVYNGMVRSPDTGEQVNPLLFKRSLDFGGQSLRYCDETQPGSASHKTSHWNLRASGGVGGVPDANPLAAHPFRWEGTLNLFDDPSLEGADQPPFYPVLDSAVIRVDQIERMTGSGAQAVTVQQDGWYVKNGIYEPNDKNTGLKLPVGSPYDPLQIYLDVVSSVSMSMGKNGDRSGGVFRPGGPVLALCRTRGPLTGDPQHIVTATTNNWTLGSLVATAVDTVRGYFPSETVRDESAAPPSQGGATAPSVAAYFNCSPKTPDGVLQCRILGVVTIAELLNALKTSDARNSLPLLRDALEYGSAEEGAAVDHLRKDVLEPLGELVHSLLEKWKTVSGRHASSLVPTLAEIFPDVDRSLADLASALDSANGTKKDDELIAPLAAVYDSGRRLVDACTRILSNPLDTILLALGKELDSLFADLTSFGNGYPALLQEEIVIAGMSGAVTGVAQIQRLFGYPFDWMTQLYTELRQMASYKHLKPVQARAINKAVDLLESKQPDLPQITKALRSAFDAHRLPDAVAAELAASVEADLRQALVAWLAEGKAFLEQPSTSAAFSDASASGAGSPHSPEPDPSEEWMQSARDLIERDSIRLQSTNTSDMLPVTLDSLRVLLAATTTLSSAILAPQLGLQEFSTLFKGLASYFAKAFGNALLPTPKQLQSLLSEALQPIKDAVELIADPKVTLPVEPKIPDGANDFVVPEDWKVLGSSNSLVASLDALAHAAALALRSKPLKDLIPLRKDLVAVGQGALKLQIELLEYAKELQVDLDAVGAIDEDLLNKPVQVKKLLETSVEKTSDICERLNTYVNKRLKPLARDAEDTSFRDALSSTEVVPEFRTLLTKELQWLAKLNTGGIAFLKKLGDVNPDLTLRARSTAESNQQALQLSIEFDKANGSTVDAEWLKNPAKWWPTLRDPLDASTPDVGLQFAIANLQAAMSRQVDILVTTESKGLDKLLSACREMLRPIQPAYKTLAAARATGWSELQATPLAVLAGVLLVDRTTAQQAFPADRAVPVDTPLSPTNDQLQIDAQSLERLIASDATTDADRAKALRYIKAFIDQWSAGTASPQRLLEQVKRISVEDLRARLLDAFDFAARREEIEALIKRLIPISATVSYDFKTSIDAEKAKQYAGGVFLPAKQCELIVHSEARVDFINSTKPTALSRGSLGKFDIKLIGEEFDAVTLHFDGVTFESNGGPVNCDMKYAGFTLGNELQFLEQLAPYFNAPPGSGFYMKALDTGLGLEAGYGLPVGTISLGDISFFNISLNAAARLRFDDKEATFVASLSRRDAPFTISAAPYGGSGFFSLEADAKGLAGFEASFEYGGAAAFAYGPLEGQGRLMVGVYIRSTRSTTDISATFFAGGSASIWVFSFGASLYVCARPKDNHMVGDATFTFSFSLGIVDYDYSCTVHVSLAWGGGGGDSSSVGSASDYLGEGILLAEVDPDLIALTRTDLPTQHTLPSKSKCDDPQKAKKDPKAPLPGIDVPLRVVDTWCQALNWREYIDYFDLDLKAVKQEA